MSIDDLLTGDLRPAGIQLSKNLRHLRKREGYTQIEMADLLNVTPKCVSFYELGEKKPSLERLVNISEFFGVTVDDLLKKDLEKEDFDVIKTRRLLNETKKNELINTIGNLVIENGLTYNQIKDVFDSTLECLKDFPYQATTVPKKYAEVRLELLSQEERDLLNRTQSSSEISSDNNS